MKYSADVVIVGAGLFGLTCAIELREKFNLKSIMIEKRSHVGGNAYSYLDSETNIEIHKYGSHIFHTNNDSVWNYVNRYSEWIPYEHRVFTNSSGEVFPLPVNLLTLGILYNRIFSPTEAKEFLIELVGGEQLNEVISFEEKAIQLVGKDIYHRLLEGYTSKQWGKHPKELPADILTRLPIRGNFDSRYFSDKYQALPANGYGVFLENMARSSKSQIFLNVDWKDFRSEVPNDIPVIYSGPIDEYFDYSEGELEWRTLDFELETLRLNDFQGTPVMNYADSKIPFTRIHEFKHYPSFKQPSEDRTIIMREYSRIAFRSDEKYYPIENHVNKEILNSYRNLAKGLSSKVIFGGRLGSYKYLDMHMAIASAFSKMSAEFSA